LIKKGILLLGGTGSRLFPVTKSVNKHLLCVYNKPMFFYPLSVLMLANIRDILIVTAKNESKVFKNLLGNTNDLGLKISYEEQITPGGIPDALSLGREFSNNKSIALILGDNFFYGSLFSDLLKKSFQLKSGCGIYLYPTKNISSFAAAELNKKNKIIKIVEKPKKSKSNLAVSGLYLFDNKVFEYVNMIYPSKRKELEIVDIIKIYKKNKKLNYFKLGRGSAWMDMGTFEDLFEVNNFVKNLENRQNYQIACLEEIALNKKWVTKKNVKNRINFYKNSSYSNYLKNIII
jgi:glucose-1-phosphate thymidylyltransferase